MENDMMITLNKLRLSLDKVMKPEVLDFLLKLKEALGDEDGLLARYSWFMENSEAGENCHYAKMAKHLFVENNSDNVIELIKILYENFAGKE